MKNSLKKILSLIAAAVMLLTSAMSVTAEEEEEKLPEAPEIVNCKGAYLFNVENDKVLFEYNSTASLFPASTVKLMTAIVTFDKFGGALDTQLTITQSMLNEAAGNRIGFYDGEVVTVRQMLTCMLVNSANDAAIILANTVADSTAAFVRMMNEKAAWIGAYDTNYTNPTGLHDELMVTTAADTALIAKYAYSIPGLVEITSTSKYVMDATNRSDYRSIYNRNSMISKYYSTDYYYPTAIGLNAGATTQGGYAICAAARNDETNLTYIAVVLGAGSDDDGDPVLYHYTNAISMLDWAFKAYDYALILSKSKIICELPVSLSSTLDYVTLVPEKDITAYLPTSFDPATDIRYSYNTYSDSLKAPVEAGSEAGTITVLYGDEIMGSCSLITTSSIARSDFLYTLEKIKAFTQSRLFWGTIIAAVILTAVYLLYTARKRENKIKRMTTRR